MKTGGGTQQTAGGEYTTGSLCQVWVNAEVLAAWLGCRRGVLTTHGTSSRAHHQKHRRPRITSA